MSSSHSIYHWFKNNRKRLIILFLLVLFVSCLSLTATKIYQHWDDDPDRGAIALKDGFMGENFSVPTYLKQGWSASDSLWFYNTTQGSNLIPYDFFLSLEVAGGEDMFASNKVFDQYRYLPQKPTFFNPDGLAVGFVKDTYQGKDYIGYTCAACHTGQVNYQGQAIRIDGGPAMADMDNYLKALYAAMFETMTHKEKRNRFIERVIERDNDYQSKKAVFSDLRKWASVIENYNTINHSEVDYGFARLDAFGRIYNRVLQHVVNKAQAKEALLSIPNKQGLPLLTDDQVDLVLDGVDETIIGDQQFALIIDRLTDAKDGYPGLSKKQMLKVRDSLFNSPNAPVSYPFLWDITHSDYVQWNGLAGNSGVGPIGRNAGEVIGVFGTLDWVAKEPGFSISGMLTKQSKKHKQIDFSSSIDLMNLRRLEDHLKSLQSPEWPAEIFGELDHKKVDKGRLIYEKYCESCHIVVERDNWDRIVIAQLSNLDAIGTDPQMALNSVNHSGKTGNFKYTYQPTDVGDFVLGDDAPVALTLTAATKGVVATPDPDKSFIRRWVDWLYTLISSATSNTIESSIKQGTYHPDTTAQPLNSLLAYKARSLNGIWATPPYLHNGSVPSLYDLLLPVKREGDPEDGEYRPNTFYVGLREFDIKRVGYVYKDQKGFLFDTSEAGNLNTGHEYAAGRTAQPSGEILPPLTKKERWQLVEYLKSL